MQSVETKSEPITDAWIIDAKNINAAAVHRVQQQRSSCRLGLIEKLSSTEMVFHVYSEADGKYLRQSSAAIQSHTWYSRKEIYKFVLSGASVWRIVSVVEFDRGDGAALELTLAQERI